MTEWLPRGSAKPQLGREFVKGAKFLVVLSKLTIEKGVKSASGTFVPDGV